MDAGQLWRMNFEFVFAIIFNKLLSCLFGSSCDMTIELVTAPLISAVHFSFVSCLVWTVLWKPKIHTGVPRSRTGDKLQCICVVACLGLVDPNQDIRSLPLNCLCYLVGVWLYDLLSDRGFSLLLDSTWCEKIIGRTLKVQKTNLQSGYHQEPNQPNNKSGDLKQKQPTDESGDLQEQNLQNRKSGYHQEPNQPNNKSGDLKQKQPTDESGDLQEQNLQNRKSGYHQEPNQPNNKSGDLKQKQPTGESGDLQEQNQQDHKSGDLQEQKGGYHHVSDFCSEDGSWRVVRTKIVSFES